MDPVPIALFVMIFAIVAVVMFFRFRNRQELQITVRAAVDSGQPLSAEALESLTAALQPKRNDLRRGVILLAIGLAVVCFAYAVGAQEGDVVGPLLGISAFPFFTGLASILLWFLSRDKKQ